MKAEIELMNRQTEQLKKVRCELAIVDIRVVEIPKCEHCTLIKDPIGLILSAMKYANTDILIEDDSHEDSSE